MFINENNEAFSEITASSEYMTLCSPEKMIQLTKMVTTLIEYSLHNKNISLTPDEARFVASLYKGSIDLWCLRAGR